MPHSLILDLLAEALLGWLFPRLPAESAGWVAGGAAGRVAIAGTIVLLLSSLGSFVIRRGAQSVITIFGVMCITFLLFRRWRRRG